MIFQDPMTSLNPVLTIGRADPRGARDTLRPAAKEADARAVELLDQVGIPSAKLAHRDYPHQFSGGMRQRAMIAMALACEPKLLIADEPTTALDVTIQAQILDLLRALVAERGTALILITHDLGVVAGMCERVNVMYAGTLVETGTAEQLFARPRHPYTLGLLQSVPRLDAGRASPLQPIAGQPRNMLSPPAACPFAPRCRYALDICTEQLPRLESRDDGHKAACFNPVPADEWKRSRVAERNRVTADSGSTLVELDDLRVWFPIKSGLVLDRHVGDVKAVDGVSLTIERGETLGLVGESGCGKSTVGRAILRLYEPTSGRIVFDGHDITALSEGELRVVRRRMQMVFQDPYASLNPRHSVGRIVGEPLRVHGLASGARSGRASGSCSRSSGCRPTPRRATRTSSPAASASGSASPGRSRSTPSFVVCDEPVSALDVSIQAQIINLLEELQHEFGLTYLFIAHDLAVVRHISDRIAVMYLGKIVEVASADELYDNPLHPYTISLLSAVPIPDPEVERSRRPILSRATCRARRIRRRAAASTRAARSCSRHAAATRSRSCASSTATSSRATSPSRSRPARSHLRRNQLRRAEPATDVLPPFEPKQTSGPKARCRPAPIPDAWTLQSARRS